MSKMLDFYQQKELAGFRKRFSAVDHLQINIILIDETDIEYSQQMWIAGKRLTWLKTRLYTKLN